MLQEGNIIYFDPFYFKNGNPAKPKYFVVLNVGKEGNILASLPTRRDNIPEKHTIDDGCIDLPEFNFNCFVISPKTIVTDCGKSFDFPTHIYGYQLDIYKTEMLEEIYPIKDVDYSIWGKMKDLIFADLVDCLKNSKTVKMKYVRILSSKN